MLNAHFQNCIVYKLCAQAGGTIKVLSKITKHSKVIIWIGKPPAPVNCTSEMSCSIMEVPQQVLRCGTLRRHSSHVKELLRCCHAPYCISFRASLSCKWESNTVFSLDGIHCPIDGYLQRNS